MSPSVREPAPGDDRVVPFTVPALDVRGRVARLGPLVDDILSRHAYPAPVAKLLAETIVLTALLGSALKFDGRFILQTQTDGPVHLLVVDYQTPDAIRAYAGFDAGEVAAAEAAGRISTVDLLGTGRLAMTVDQGAEMSRYQGIVVLDGESLEEAAHRYFAQSEQIPTRVRLAVSELYERVPGGTARRSWRAGGLLAQFLPQSEERLRRRDLPGGDAPEGTVADEIAEDDAWMEALALVDTIEDDELTDPKVSADELLFRLFHERGARRLEDQPLIARCRCSRARSLAMLRQFRAEDVAEMVVDGAIVVTCEFCSTAHRFDPAEID